MKHIKLFENFSEEEKPKSITIELIDLSKFINQYKTGNEFNYHSRGLADGNWSKLQNGELTLENGYYYPMFRCITDLEKFRESKFKLGAYIIYLSYSKEHNEVLISMSNESLDMDITSSNGQDKFKSLSDNARHWYTKFKKVEAGEVDGRGYFKIVEVK